MAESSIRVGRATDADRYVATDETVWFAEVSSLPAAEQLLGLPEEQRFAADVDGSDPGTYPGIYGVLPLTLGVPGPDAGARPVPCAGLTWVGVHPDHRRRGVLTAMMRHHLEQVHAQDGTAVSALHASEPGIYGRYGYGLASLELEVVLSRGTPLVAPLLDRTTAAVTTHLGSLSDADMPKRMRECHLATAELGAVVGDLGYYARVCRLRPEELRDKEPWRILLARRDGADVGFAVFRRTERWERNRPAGSVEVWAVVGEPAARLALLRRLVDLDLVTSVKVRTVGAADPLLAWVGGPRAATDVGTYDSLWVRLVDLPDALMNRAWSATCDVVVDVTDGAAPWNAGRWRLHADDAGAAVVERTTADVDLGLTVDALGAAYLGGGNLLTLLRAGQLAENRPGAAAELWRALRTDLPPAAAVGF
jgi:GNAT superfamily N-acetyltransferase